jgi:hypothetical protein
VANDLAKICLQEVNAPGKGQSTLASMHITTSYSTHWDIISATSWLCASLRFSPSTTVCTSTTSVVARSSDILLDYAKSSANQTVLFFGPNELINVQTEVPCWHALFPHSVIAHGFQIRDRVEGKGLEISFADMALLSRSLSFTEFQGGLILEGLKSVLIPVAELPEDKALQWHFADRTKIRARRTPNMSKVFMFNKISSWYKQIQPDCLAERRCFLGWVEEGNTVIGTESYSTMKVKTSRAEPSSVSRLVKSHSISVAINAVGFATITGARSYVPCSMPSRLTFPVDKDIYDILSFGRYDHVIIYDEGTKTAWTLPQASVVLYLAHQFIDRSGYKLYDQDRPTSLGFSQPSPDGAASALGILRASLEFKVRKFESGSRIVEEPFSTTVKQIWHMFNKIRTGLETAEAEYEKVGYVAPKYLHGVELIDVLNMEECMTIKEALIKQPWAHLVAHQPVVLFTRGLGQHIIPSSSNKLCDLWKVVPANMNYLVAMGTAVSLILEEEDDDNGAGSRLSGKIEWRRDNVAIKSHQSGGREYILHTQSLYSVRTSKFDKGLRNAIEMYAGGCFVFSSQSSRQYCRKIVNYQEPSLSSSRPNAPTSTLSNKPLPEVPEFASATSAGTNQDSGDEVLLGASDLSQESSYGSVLEPTKDVGKNQPGRSSDRSIILSEQNQGSISALSNSYRSESPNSSPRITDTRLKKMPKYSDFRSSIPVGRERDINVLALSNGGEILNLNYKQPVNVGMTVHSKDCDAVSKHGDEEIELPTLDEVQKAHGQRRKHRDRRMR